MLKFFVKLSKGDSIKYFNRGSSLINLHSLNIFLESDIMSYLYEGLLDNVEYFCLSSGFLDENSRILEIH